MSERIEVIQGDITTMQVDAIVNAANTQLKGGGGVDGAIHRAGGPKILQECRQIIAKQGKCPTGEAVVTSGGEMLVGFVIHTVGPVWNGGKKKEPQLLAACYKNSLNQAVANQCTSVAFPNISTGVYGFPKPLAAEIAVREVRDFLATNQQLEKVVFCCFDLENFSLIEQELRT